ncbi:Uncharacterized mitochondrial protein AtMg00310 [Linum perenne]
MNPDLLLSRLLKGKYFPSRCFLNATKRSNPSWGWQSILHGRELLLQGLLWRLGAPSTLTIFERPWIPRYGFPSFPVLLRPGAQSHGILISSFISQGEWDVRRLSAFFDEESIRIILNIPLPRISQLDHPIWFFSSRGVYSTSSGYSLALRLRPVKKTPPSLTEPSCPALWGSIWDLQIQPKFRFFLWRLCHRILPTIEGLNSRGMSLPTTCPCCLRGPKTLEHFLFHCIVARRLMQTLNLDLESIPHSHPAVTWRFIQSARPLEGPHWVLAWWRLWKSRNWVVFEKFQKSIPALHRQFSLDVDNLSFLPAPLHSAPSVFPTRPTVWSPPRFPRLKINVDGAILASLGGACGLVVRDYLGGLLFATGISYPGITNPFLLELLAVRDACVLCRNLGWREVDIEGDATEVLRVVSGRLLLSRDGGSIISDICSLLDSLPLIKLQVVPRQANMTAHYVARQALRSLPSRGVVNLTAWVCP